MTSISLFVMSKEKNLKILESHRSLYVYYVREEDKVEIKGKDGNLHQIYKKAYPCKIEDLDVINYSKFVFENGYQPPATQVAKVFPNPNGIFPGIMIRESQDFYINWGKLYYAIKRKEKQMYATILQFEKKVYTPLNDSRKAFERGLVELVERFKKPELAIDLFLLTEPEARFVRYGEIDLEDALDKGVRLSIDHHAVWLMGLHNAINMGLNDASLS